MSVVVFVIRIHIFNMHTAFYIWTQLILPLDVTQPSHYKPHLAFITVRIPKEWGRLCFHPCLSVCSHLGGYPPSQVRTGGLPPSQVRMGGTPIWCQDGGHTPTQVRIGGYPNPGQDGGNPSHQQDGGTPCPGSRPERWEGTPNQSNIACTYYAAGSMPLAFTREDFLVF